ncbi:BspA family leucine-rich repeat surface protein [Aquimarina agarilytica]|uniref:BspA family leucine-rich repeat surface protein n=1 Tax=Aquimarina agarilytica TaxID=1087449 RepID=UPI000288EB33|nr:BspA family leucine-rich repeat surface protein [Aquimarina agarilytica]
MKKFILQFTLLFTSFMFAQTDPNAFILKYEVTMDTDNVHIGINKDFTGYNFDINWGDGTSDTNISDDIIHQFTAKGEYIVSITGDFPALQMGSTVNETLTAIEQWGTNEWQSGDGMFKNCFSLKTINATDLPNFTKATSLKAMFVNCVKLEADISKWNVSTIEDMSFLLNNAKKFNSPLNDWDMSNVKTIAEMFTNAETFNQILDKWDVSKVTDMSGAFSGINNSFNRPLNNWDVSNVKTMEGMFVNSKVFNQPLDKWDVSNVVDMSKMFFGTASFNQNINNWKTVSLENAKLMFASTGMFNQPLDAWEMGKVINIESMFQDAKAFNKNINGWNTANVEQASFVFRNALKFNQPLNNWKVAQITSKFESVFEGAVSFDQSLEQWYPRNEISMRFFFNNSGMSSENYTKTLVFWIKQPDIASNVRHFSAEAVTYCEEAVNPISILKNELKWTFYFDGGLDATCGGNTLSSENFDKIKKDQNTMFFNYNTKSLTIDAESNKELSVYDLSGREVLTKQIKVGASTQSLNELRPAVYILKLQNKNLEEKELLKIILN